MKLDSPDAPHTQPLAPQDWEMEMFCEGSQYLAQLTRNAQPMCRLSIAREGLNESQARTELAEKARAWIAEYLRRAHSGTTEFGAP